MAIAFARFRRPTGWGGLETRAFAILAALLLAGSYRSAQAAEMPAWAATNIAGALAITRDLGETNPRPARFQGTVIYSEHPSMVCLQDGRAGILVRLPRNIPMPRRGDRLEIEGSARFNPDDSETDIVAEKWRNLGPGPLPEPARERLLDALNGSRDRQWIEAGGVVMQARAADGVLMLHMTDESGWAVVNVHNWTGGPLPPNLWGANLALRGANIGRGHRAVRVESMDDLKILRPGAARLFDAPLTNAAALRAQPGPTRERYRLRATVLKLLGEDVYLREGSEAFRATYLQPFSPGSSDPDRFELIPDPIPTLKPGDRVELVGSPLEVKSELKMHFCAFRRIGEGGQPRAAEIRPLWLINGTAVNELARVSGRLLSREQARTNNMIREILKLDADGVVFSAALDSSRGGQLEFLNVDDLVELTGLVTPAGAGGYPYILRLFSPADARALWLSPRVERQRMLRTVAAAAALLLAAGGWIALLRHRLAARERAEAAMREANAILEERVRDRTAELEGARDGLRRALEQERELHELKSRFVSMVSHEFRTPLSIIMSSAEILEAYLDRLPPEERAANLRDIFHATRHMTAMIEEVLLLSRVEAGKLKCQVAPLDLPAICARFVDEVASAMGYRCPIETSIAAEGEAAGDETLLRHILINVLDNAVKYSPPGAPVQLAVERRGPLAEFRIRDSGIGIPETDARQLFTAFHRGRNVGNAPGTGLGMTIVRSCLELHGGSISFDSREGRGTTFVITLPLFASNAASNGVAAFPARDPVRQTHSLHEDHPRH